MSLPTGQPYPIGATVQPGGVNFCVFSKNATAIELLLFDSEYDRQPARVIALNVVRNEEAKAKVPVLVDLTGELRKAPWNLPSRSSNVLVISPAGELLFQATGKIEGERLDELVKILRNLLTNSLPN